MRTPRSQGLHGVSSEGGGLADSLEADLGRDLSSCPSVAAAGHGGASDRWRCDLQLSVGVVSSLVPRIRSATAHSHLWLRPEAAL